MTNPMGEGGKNLRVEDPGTHADHHELDEPFLLLRCFPEIDHIQSCLFALIK